MPLHQFHHNSIEDLQNKSLDLLEQILAQLKFLTEGQKGLKNNVRILNEENSKRADEIKCLPRVNDALLTEDDNTEDKKGERTENGSSDSESQVENRLTQPTSKSDKEAKTNQLPHTRELRI